MNAQERAAEIVGKYVGFSDPKIYAPLIADVAAALTEAAKPNKDQALLWDAAVEAFGPEPFKELDSRGNCDCGSGFNGLIVAIRSRMEKP